MMSRRAMLQAAAGVALILLGAVLILQSRGSVRDARIAGAAVRILEPTRSPQAGAAIVFHGLSANRIVMQQPGQWLAAQGLRVFLVDAPGHGDSEGHFTHTETLDSSIRVIAELLRDHQIDLQTTILVGHSMGGEIAIRLADYFPTAATIALSPAPMVLPRRMPSNLLVVSGQFDFSPMKQVAEELLRSAGGQRTSPEDFQQRRAADRITVPWASHTSVMFDLRASKVMAAWSRMALGLHGPLNEPRGAPLAGEILGILGLCLIFPIIVGWIVRACRAGRIPDQVTEPRSLTILLANWSVASVLAVSIAGLWYPQWIFPFYAGGYLTSFLLFAGTALALLFRDRLPDMFDCNYRAVLSALILGAVVILGLGTWLNWQLTDAWMNHSRWAWFLPLLLANLPYALVEEVALGPPGAARSTRRFVVFFALRFTMWIALAAGVFLLLSGQVLMVLLVTYFFCVSLGQRLGADLLRRHTGSATAAAIFSAILAAWFIAAVFPLA